MAKTNEHGRIIAAAAKAALVSLGCVRKGQSRVWYSDQRYWVIAVEFQPSAWSKGSYLNIFVGWLWKTSDSYPIRYRPFNFISFESAQQFTPLVRQMAETAACEVVKVRKQFESFDKIHSYIVEHANRDSWPVYNAAISSALIGDLTEARRFFDKIAEWTTHGYQWEEKLKKDSAALAAIVGRPKLFRAAILNLIAERRQLMRLPPDPNCLDALDSIATP